VRCATWDQVETFTSRKLRKGKLLSMKVPFTPAIGSAVTLGLELPNEVVVAIDGTVQQASVIEAEGRTWIEVELHGFTSEVVDRIKQMASGMAISPVAAPIIPRKQGPTAPPPAAPRTSTVDSLPQDERELFQHLTTELKRLRQAAVHDVLGVPYDADAETIRAGWMRLIRRHHPDLVARRKAPAISHLAEELTILTNRAYDRLRMALVAEGRATAIGATVSAPPGWLVGFDELASAERATGTTMPPPARGRDRIASIPPVNVASGSGPAVHGGDTFETRARQMLGAGQADNAQEVLAAALVVYPRSKPLRSLYYVAAAVAAIEKGEVMLATSQLETALAHYDQCFDATRILDYLRKAGQHDPNAIRRMFQ
jgi:DnaJ-domain-containing protein 1